MTISITFYIAIPYDYDYDWSIVQDLPTPDRGKSVDILLSRLFGAKVKFMFNGHAGFLSNHDIYKVVVNNEHEQFLFTLRTGFRQFSEQDYKDYLEWKMSGKYPRTDYKFS